MSTYTSGDLDQQDLAEIAAAAAEHDAAHGTDGNQRMSEQPPLPTYTPPDPSAAPAQAPGPAPSPAPAQAPAAPATAPTPAAPAAAPATTPDAGTQDKPQGDVRAALRASRRSEYRTRQEKERLEKELDELKKKVGVTDSSDTLPEKVLEDVKLYAPEAAAHIERLQAQVKATAPAAAQPSTEFRPMQFDPDTQDLIDDIPQLAAWHADPDQTNFMLARRAVGLLAASPAWADKSAPEIHAEAVRQVQQLGKPAAPAPAPDPASRVAAAVAAAPVVHPSASIGGMGSGTQPQPMQRDYSRMTDEQILALGPDE